MQYYNKNNQRTKKMKKLRNDVKAVEELDKFIIEGMNNENISDDENWTNSKLIEKILINII